MMPAFPCTITPLMTADISKLWEKDLPAWGFFGLAGLECKV